MRLRKYHPKDLEEIGRLFYDTIHSVNLKDYTEEQVNAWAPLDNDLVRLNNKLSNQYCVVAEKNNTIVGIGTMDNTGYFDLLYTHKDYQGLGIATLIANELEDYITRKGIKIIKADASITAVHFFEKRGYKKIKENHIDLRGQILINFSLEKQVTV